MLILITSEEKDPISNMDILITSHAYDSKTLESVVLPQIPPWELGAEYDEDMTHWVIRDKQKRAY